MSTLDRMLSVLMAAREARHRSPLRLGTDADASSNDSQTVRRRRTKSTTLTSETLEPRQLLAVTAFSEAYGTGESWTTIVAEPGDNVYLQQVSTREATLNSKESLYIADNSSFQRRIQVGGPKVDWLDTSQLAEQQLVGFDATQMRKISITTGTARRDTSVQSTDYPMSAPFTTSVSLHADEPGNFTVSNRRLRGSIAIEQADGSISQWTFDNDKYTRSGAIYFDGLPEIRTGVGVSTPAPADYWYPVSITPSYNQLQVTWNAAYLPRVPTVSVIEGTRSWGTDPPLSFGPRTPSAPDYATLILHNATGPGLGAVIASTFSGTLQIDDQQFTVTVGTGERDASQLFFNGKASGQWGASFGNGQRERMVQGTLVGSSLQLQMFQWVRKNGDSDYSYRQTAYPIELSNARYAVATGGNPVSATIFAGHDILASLDINLLTSGSHVFIDSPVRTRSGNIELAATDITLNAPVSTPDQLLIHRPASSRTNTLEQATAVAIIKDGQVSALVIPSGRGGVGYDSAAPTVTIEAPRSITATAQLVSLSNGSVRDIFVTNGGIGYTIAPTVTLSGPQLRGGRPATAVATLRGDSVASIEITDPGTGYTSVPAVTLTAALGTGATATARFTGSPSQAKVINPGSGYQPNATLPITISSADGGTGATGFVVINGKGAVDRIEFAGGTGYTFEGTTITLPAPNSTAASRQAKAEAIVDPTTSRIVGFNITDAGSGYGQTPAVTISAPRRGSDELRPAATVSGGLVTDIKFLSGTGLRARVGGVAAGGAIATASVAVGYAGTGYAVGDLISIDSQSGGTGQAAQIRVLEVGAAGSVKRLGVVWGGSGYTVGETLTHDGKPATGYGYQAAPRVWIERPAAADGEQAKAIANLDAFGRITGITMINKGRGYTSAPAVQIESLFPLAQAETVNFNAAVAAGFYSIYLDDDRGTPTVDRSTLFVSNSASLASSFPAADGSTLPAKTVLVESHRGDVIVSGSINAEKQSYLFQSDPQDVMLFPYRFVARVPGDTTRTPVIKGGTVAVTLANDLPTLTNGGIAANEVSLQTQIDSLRIRTAWRSGADRTDPFPYTASIDEADDIAIDALAASGWPLLLTAAGDMRFNAAIDTANDLVITGVKGLSVTAPVKSGRTIIFDAQEVAVNNSVNARADLVISASNGDITLSGGLITAGKTVRLNQKNKKVPKTNDYRSPQIAIAKGKTTVVPISVSDEFITDDVNITLSITNPTLQYVSATLVSPAGARVPLFGYGTLSGLSMKDTLFNDEASKNIREGSAPYSVAAGDLGFRPALYRLSTFKGFNAAGTWQLEVTSPSYGSDGTIDGVVLSLRDPVGGSVGQIASTSTIAADGLVIEAEGSVAANTDVNTVSALVDGSLALADQGAMNVVSLRAGGAVSLSAAGVDPVTVDPITKRRSFGSALRATLLDVGNFSVAAPNGSVDVVVTAAKSIQLGNLGDTASSGMRAAGSVSIRSLGGSSGGDISAFDAPLAGGNAKKAKLASQAALRDVLYVAGTPGLYPSTLTATKNGQLATAIGGAVSLQAGDTILVANGTVADGQKANGIYTVVNPGSDAAAWKLVRATDFDTTTELPAGSIVTVSEGSAAGTYFRIDYQTTADKPFGYADMSVLPLTVTANIGCDDPFDGLRFVVSTTGGDNSSRGSLGKMILLAQQNDTSSSDSNPVQKTDLLFSSTITTSIRLTQELPLIQQPLIIDGASRWNPYTNTLDFGSLASVDGTRIATTRTGSTVTTQTVVNGFVFTSSAGGSQAGRFVNMVVGGFNQGSAVVVDSAKNLAVDSNWIGLDRSGNRLGNRIGVTVISSTDTGADGVVVSNNKIGGSGVAAVSLQGKAGGVSLFGNTIGFDGGDNVLGVDVTTTGHNSIGLLDRTPNIISYNSTGIRLGVNSGTTTTLNSEISHNVISGISILGGKHVIGQKGNGTSSARNAVFANSGWGIRIDGASGDTATTIAQLAADQTIQNNLFISPSAAVGDKATRNLRGAIGIRTANGSTVEDYSLTTAGKVKYAADPGTGADPEENQYVAVADTVGPGMTLQAAQSASGAVLPGRISGSGLFVSGDNAGKVKTFVLRIADSGSGVAAATVVKEAFALSFNGTPLTEGDDYTFSVSGSPSKDVLFTCALGTGFFTPGRYVLTATGKAGTSSGSGPATGGRLTDNANNALQGNTANANVTRFTMLLTDVPQTVTGVVATAGDTSAQVRWTAPQELTGAPITDYVVEYAAAGGGWQAFSHPASTGTSLTVMRLTNGVSYSFRVAAVNDAGQGAFSATSATVTPQPLPSAPLALLGSTGNQRVVLTWVAPLTDGGADLTDYVVQSSTNDGLTWQTVMDGVRPITGATVDGLTNGTAYVFRVAAVTTAGQGAWTAATARLTPIGLPGIPSGLNTIGNDGSAVLTWTAPSNNGGTSISDYAVQKSSDGGTTWFDVVDGVSATPTATVRDLINGTSYVLRVAAKATAGLGAWSQQSSPVTPRSVASAPRNVLPVAGDGQATITWLAPTSNGGTAISNYVVQKSSDGGNTWLPVTRVASTTTSQTVDSLTNGTSYVFRVAAVTEAGTGNWLEATSEVTPHGLAAAPLNVTPVIGNGQVDLSWSVPTATGGSPIRDYVVQFSNDGGAHWTTFTHSPSPATRIAVTGLVNGSSYKFRVAAVTDFATGALSAATAAVVPLAAPGVVTDLQSVPGTGQIVLTWQAPINNGGTSVVSYDIEYKATGSSQWQTWPHVAAAATSATITGLAATSGYVFRVTAVTEFSHGPSVETTESVVLVPPPTRVAGRAVNGSVLLAWMPPRVTKQMRVIDYRIQYSADGGATWITASKAASTSARATVRGLTSGVSYIFRIAVVTAKGVGAYSVSSTSLIPR